MVKKWKILASVPLPLSTLLCLNLTSCGQNCKYPEINIACMGDSITYGLLPNGKRMGSPYPLALQQELSVNFCYNMGVCGSTISDGFHSHLPMVNRINSIPHDVNMIISWGGVNDYITNCELGTKSDMDHSTIYGSLNSVCDYLTKKYSDKFIMFITPLPTTIKPTSYQLSDVCDAIQYTCSRFNIPVLDLYKDSGFEKEMTQPYSDGLHPTQEFILNSIVPKISTFIKEKIK